MQLADGRLDPALIPFEIQPGAFDPRYQRWELWPEFNPSCIWRVKSGGVELLPFGAVYSFNPNARTAIEQLGLNWNALTQMTAMSATATIESAMSAYTTKQKADLWKKVVAGFLGFPYTVPDAYVWPTAVNSSVILTQPGTRVVRGPFASPRHIVHMGIRNVGSGYRPLTVDVLLGCDEGGESPAATLRLRVERTAAIAAGQPLNSHVLTPIQGGGWGECDLTLELLNAAGTVVETARMANFPDPFDPPGTVTNNDCSLGETILFPLRLAFSTEGAIQVEAIITQRSVVIGDELEIGMPGNQLSAPPLRHLFAPLDGPHDIGRIAVYLSRADGTTVDVVHRPLERNDKGVPDFINVSQGTGCEESDAATDAIEGGTKTVCTTWSRSCHVTHSNEDECYTELDVDFAGNVPVNVNNSADIAAVLQGTFTLGNTNADGHPLWHNSFWFHDDEPVTVGAATRDRIEISAVIGAHWPVPVCIGEEYPVEISLFARAILSAPASAVYSAVLRCRVSQRLLLGEKRSPDYWGDLGDDQILWDTDFPWGVPFYDKITTGANALLVNLTKCDFQLK